MILPTSESACILPAHHDIALIVQLLLIGVQFFNFRNVYSTPQTSPHSLTFGRDPGGYASSDRSREFAPSLLGFAQPAKSGISGLGLFKKSLKVVVEVCRGASVRQKICTIDAARNLRNIDLVDLDRTLDP
jgi:hypothetical protein